jgi:isoleucyl-tRNA synthetase
MLGEDGQKMSKRKRNYLPPDEIFDRYGADALRWYFFANQPPWTSIRYNEQSIKDSIPEFLLRLWNVYSFFVIYANIDGFDPSVEVDPAAADTKIANIDAPALSQARTYREFHERAELDRWILNELYKSCGDVVECMDHYDNFGAAQRISDFVDALSNWYVRRSRDRFWAAHKRSTDKLDAYWTLYECLLTTAKLIAPFVPYIAETIWQNLARNVFKERAHESVHLCDYPDGKRHYLLKAEPGRLEALSEQMLLLREITSLGRNARNAANLKVRQPLTKVEVVLANTTHQKWLEEHAGLIAEELNVKEVAFTTHGEEYISYTVVPNFKRLGPRLGKNMPAAKKALSNVDEGWLNLLRIGSANVSLPLPDGTRIDLEREDVEIRLTAKEGWAAAQGKASVVVLSTELTSELIEEGLANDFLRLIQDRRKDSGCQYTDRIEIGLVTDSADVRRAIEQFRDHIMKETLAERLVFEPLPNVTGVDAKVGDATITLYVRVVG